VNPHYPYEHLANVGSRSYQRAWVRHAIAAAAAGRLDGIMMDNVLGLVSGWTGGVYPAAYPNDGAWEKAMRNFVRFVGPALKKHKLYVLANTFKGGSNDGSADVRWWKTVAPYVSGLMAEYWESKLPRCNHLTSIPAAGPVTGTIGSGWPLRRSGRVLTSSRFSTAPRPIPER
jgi:Hypothetical glycosyl hydrolase family 15